MFCYCHLSSFSHQNPAMMPREQQAVGSPIDFYSHTGHHRSDSLTEVYSVPGTSTPFSSVQFCSVTLSCLTLCDPMNRSTPGLPVYPQLPEFTQTHVHRVSDAIQPSHLCRPLFLLPPIPPSIRVFSNESTLRMRWP